MSRHIMQEALNALKYHQEQTRPIYQTGVVIELLEAELSKPEQPDLRKAADMALDALKNYHKSDDDRLAVAMDILHQALAKPEQELDYPPECTTPELEVAYAAGWWKALEVQRNKQQALDKKADNARELGLDYEPEHGFDRTASHMAGEYMYTKQQNVNTSEERVQKSEECVHEPVAWLHPDKKIDVIVPSSLAWFDSPIPLYTAPTKREWVGLTDIDIHVLKMNYDKVKVVYTDRAEDLTVLGQDVNVDGLISAIEAKLKEKNNGNS